MQRLIQNYRAVFAQIRQKQRRCARRIRTHERQNVAFSDIFNGTLRIYIKFADGFHFIVEKLYAQRQFQIDGINVDNAAARAELTELLHFVRVFVAERYQFF